MECMLFRHGIAVERDEWEGDDGDRPLTEKGAKRVAQAAAGLRWLEAEPTHVWSSPLARARETADILQAALGLRAEVRQVDELLPEAPPDRLLSLLQELPSDACVVCVGHEPQLGLAASVLLAGKPSMAFRFKKAGACLIELPAPPKPGRGVLRWWMEPSQLRVLGKRRAKVEA